MNDLKQELEGLIHEITPHELKENQEIQKPLSAIKKAVKGLNVHRRVKHFRPLDYVSLTTTLI